MKTSNLVVMDASFALSLLLPDEKAHFDEEWQLFSPNLLKLEVANGLRSAVVRGRIGADLAQELYTEFLSWPIHYGDGDYALVLKAALAEKLSAYDACYVVLAREMKAKLLTWDAELAEKC